MSKRHVERMGKTILHMKFEMKHIRERGRERERERETTWEK